jgi:hypothetical protein
MSYVYSPKAGAFYSSELKDAYEQAGSWPADALVVKDADYHALAEGISNGLLVVPGKKGYPVLSAQATPGQAQLIATAEEQRDILMGSASLALAPYQDAADVGIATDEELAKLQEIKMYRVLLLRTDTSSAPDIEWPKVPDNVA